MRLSREDKIRLYRVEDRLAQGFKFGMLLFAGVLIGGSILEGILNPAHSKTNVPHSLSVICLLGFAVSALCFGGTNVIEIFVDVRSRKRPLLVHIERNLGFGIALILSVSFAATLVVMAIREWMRMK